MEVLLSATVLGEMAFTQICENLGFLGGNPGDLFGQFLNFSDEVFLPHEILICI